MTRCARHGLAVAPDGACVRCRREDAAARHQHQAQAAEPSPAALPIARARVVGTLLVVLAGCLACAAYLWSREPANAGGASVTESPLPRPMPAAMAPLAPLIAAATAAPKGGSVGGAAAEPPARPDAPAAARMAAATHKVPITMYSTAWDPGCRRARTWLVAHGYAYTERDVESDPAASRARAALTSDRGVPVIDVDGQVLTGFDEARLARALEYAAARRLER